VGRDEEGFEVLVALHGGDANDITAKAEFAEIKDFVTETVSLVVIRLPSVLNSNSAKFRR
jgi:hypothetical protein